MTMFGLACVAYATLTPVEYIEITKLVQVEAARNTKDEYAVAASVMNRVLDPTGVMVVIEAVHMCTLMRGVKTEMQRFTTSTAKGVFLTNAAPRQEFLTLFNKNGSLI